MHLLVLVAALMLMAACTTSAPVDPAAPAGVQLPPPPREVRLDGVDPCSLLTAEQRSELGLESVPKLTRPYVEFYRGEVATCTLSGPPPDSVLLVVGVITTTGIERWFDSDVLAGITGITVAGFPAVVAAPRNVSDYCSVAVGTARGQVLDVQFGGGNTTARATQDYWCDQAERTADRVMLTLLAA